MRRGFSDDALHRIAQAAKPSPKEEPYYDPEEELVESSEQIREIYRLLEQAREEENLTIEQIEDLEIQVWELQNQVNSIIEWGGQSVAWSEEMAEMVNDINQRLQQIEDRPASAIPSASESEGMQWWENYLRENPYPYPTTYF